MPEQKTVERARKKAREGRFPSTQAGEFVREEMEHISKENMAHVPPNKQSRLVSRKPGRQELPCRRAGKRRRREKLARRSDLPFAVPKQLWRF